MSRLGTCRFSYQIQEMWRITIAAHPHEQNKEEHVVLPNEFNCQWLDQAKDLPPPIARMNGGFGLRPGDCEKCKLYQPAGGELFGRKE